MALGPKQMGEAILRNLEEKTGKPLEQWLTILEKAKLTDKKPAMAFLKDIHGIGHFQAQTIFENFSGQASYENTAAFIPALFNSADLMKAYKKIETAVLKIGSDIRIQPCKTYIPFYRKNQFALVKVSKDKKIVIGLNLDDDFKHSRFKKSKAVGSGRINFQATLETIADFDKEIIEVITSAYIRN